MAKVTPPSSVPVPRSRGRFLVYKRLGGTYAHKWPRARPAKPRPEDEWLRKQFGYAARMAANAEPLNMQTAMNLTRGTEWVPRDLLMRGIYGKAYTVILPDGTVLEPRHHVLPAQPPPEAPFMGALLGQNVSQTTPDQTWTPLDWQVAHYDEEGWADLAAQPKRLTVPAGVQWVQLGGWVRFDGFHSGQILLRCTKNGTSGYPGCIWGVQHSAWGVSVQTPPIPVQEADFFELELRQTDSEGTQPDERTAFAIWRLG